MLGRLQIGRVRRARQAFWILLLLAILLLAVLLAGRVDELVEGVWTLELVGRCYLDWYTSIKALGLACPGVDTIRLWPLPPVQPWEDPTDIPRPLPGQYASKPADWYTVIGTKAGQK